jgi:hypothetical protein
VSGEDEKQLWVASDTFVGDEANGERGEAVRGVALADEVELLVLRPQLKSADLLVQVAEGEPGRLRVRGRIVGEVGSGDGSS